MKTDTADAHWNDQWATIDAESKWLTPEQDVKEWASGLAAGARILDLGAGVGRHAIWLDKMGFDVTALDAAQEGLAEIGAIGRVIVHHTAFHEHSSKIRHVGMGIVKKENRPKLQTFKAAKVKEAMTIAFGRVVMRRYRYRNVKRRKMGEPIARTFTR